MLGHAKPSWAESSPEPQYNIKVVAQKAIDVYLLSKQQNGEMGGIGWWQSANGYTAIALHDVWSGSRHNYEALAKAIKECERCKPDLINEFNDDTLWWGLCCLHVFTIGADPWFLDKARRIWKHIGDSNSVCPKGKVTFQGMDMEGACYWTTNLHEEQINSITTGLFAELSVRLALIEKTSPSGEKSVLGKILHRKRVSVAEYIESARCSLGWILRCRYRSNDAVVLDNILLQKQIAQDWTFTYCTGVAIGTCALLYEASKEEEYMRLAFDMAYQAMRRPSWVEANGVLTEPGAYGKGKHDPWQNNDAVGFKAVFLRHIGTLYEVILRTKPGDDKAIELSGLLKQFILVNLDSQQARNTNGQGQYGPWWNGPFEMPTSHSQMAVLDVMAAAVLVEARR